MSSRSEILARIRSNQPAAVALPDVPTFDGGATAPGALLERFKTGVTRMGGNVVDPPADGDLTALVHRLHPKAATIASATPEAKGNRALERVRSPAALHDVDVGIVRALFGVAETGSVWLDDGAFKVNSLGFLSQHLVVLIDPATIVPNLHHAYRARARFDVRYGVLMTGPSATADIEGVLIHGAQGIRSLTIIPVAPR